MKKIIFSITIMFISLTTGCSSFFADCPEACDNYSDVCSGDLFSPPAEVLSSCTTFCENGHTINTTAETFTSEAWTDTQITCVASADTCLSASVCWQ